VIRVARPKPRRQCGLRRSQSKDEASGDPRAFARKESCDSADLDPRFQATFQ
jgi:hypothetical protein